MAWVALSLVLYSTINLSFKKKSLVMASVTQVRRSQGQGEITFTFLPQTLFLKHGDFVRYEKKIARRIFSYDVNTMGCS